MTIAPYEQHSLELASTIEPGQNLITWARALGSAHQIASALCTTSFVPRHFANKPDEAAAALMLGDELGLSPVSALRSIFVIGGTPGLYARTMVALVQSHGHEIWTEHDSAAKVTVCGKRAGTDKIERSEWTTARARTAGYTSNKKYETDPQAMLYARASSDVCRRVAADVLAGIPYTVEELEITDEGKPAKTVRRQVERPAQPEPDLDIPSAPSVAPATTTAEHVSDEPDLAADMDGITSSQLKKMGALMREVGLTERAGAIAYVIDVIGRDVESRNDLTKAEASDVIDALEVDNSHTVTQTTDEPTEGGA